MTRRLAPLVLAPLLLAAAGVGPPEVELLLRAGNAAFDAGDYARAATFYEQAEVRATDPALVLFNRATASYHLARQGDSGALAAAEAAYRTCAAVKGPRRAQALFGLANCLLLRGGQGQPDGLVLRVAIDTYTRCLRDPGCDEALAADARYNQGRARLLLLQAAPGQGGPPPDDPGGEGAAAEDRDRPRDEKSGNGAGGPGQAKPTPGGPGSEQKQGDGPKEGGEGGRGLPQAPVSDRPDGANLPQDEAAALLRQASRRIVEDWQKHRRAMKRPSAPGARDW